MNEPTNILIIDDDPTSRHILASILRKEGFGIWEAAGGVQGRQLACSRHPDLILLDRVMPDEDGLTTCRLLRDNPATHSIPIIFVSVDGDVGVKVTAFDEGAVDYVTKPYAAAEVRARVHLHMRLSHMHKSLANAQAARLSNLAAAQEALLVRPQDLPESRFSVFRQPCHEVGGDFYDVIPISPELCDYVIADVEGHDLESSLATAALKALLRENAGPVYTPLEMVQLINDVMCRVYPEGPYMTMAYVQLNRARGILVAALAGHPPVIHVSAAGQVSLLEDQSEMVGAFSSIQLKPQTLSVKKGDRFFLFTDGLMEAAARPPHRGGGTGGAGGGLERLQALCQQSRDLALSPAVDWIARQSVPEGVPPTDDLLLLAVEV